MRRGKLGCMERSLRGLYVPLITPFTAEGDLAPGALEKLAHAVIDAGAAGLVALGTTGESATLTAAERRAVLDICARVCRERGATLIAAAGSNDTASTARSLQDLAAWPEVSAALTVVPYLHPALARGSSRALHPARRRQPGSADRVQRPVPHGTALSSQTLRQLASMPGIAGSQARRGRHRPRHRHADGRPAGDFAVLAGDDVFASPLLALGAAGGILASAHLCTSEFAALIDAWHSGRAGQARELGHRLAPLSAALFAEPNPAVIKGMLHAQGKIPSPAVRLPLLPAGQDTVRAALGLLSDRI